MVNMDAIQKEAEKDLKFTKETITEASSTTGILICKYLNYHRDYFIELNKLLKYKDQLKVLLNLYYTGKATADQIKNLGFEKPFSLKIDKIADIDLFINSNPKFSDLCLLIDNTKEDVKYIETVIDNLKFRHISIQNIINWEKFKNGN